MFNFFNEIKSSLKKVEKLDNFHLINISNRMLYVEGHRGLLTLTKELVSFKIRGGVIMVEGDGLYLLELTENTIKISGNIKKMESV